MYNMGTGLVIYSKRDKVRPKWGRDTEKIGSFEELYVIQQPPHQTYTIDKKKRVQRSLHR